MREPARNPVNSRSRPVEVLDDRQLFGGLSDGRYSLDPAAGEGSSLLGCLADHDDLHQRVHMRRLSLEATRKSRC